MQRWLWGFLLLGLAGRAQAADVTAFGAVGDGRTVNTAPLQRAIDAVAAGGGGTVDVPAGVFVSGTLSLKSHVMLRLDAGAVLKGSDDLADYQRNGSRLGLLFTQGATDTGIEGPGTLDGNGDHFMDLAHAKHMSPSDTQWTRQKDRFRQVTEGLGDGPVVPLDRPFQMIIFSDCKGVTVRNVRIVNSPFWTVHFADCDGVMVRGARASGTT
ncbi:MAG TPA: glycosyl hydrolase family 28 protein [Candidatus Xenobia bacterium]|jgi:polygalacturonase